MFQFQYNKNRQKNAGRLVESNQNLRREISKVNHFPCPAYLCRLFLFYSNILYLLIELSISNYY